MFILQVPHTSLIHKKATKDIEKPGSSDHAPKGPECMPGFFRISEGTKLISAFYNSYANSKKIIFVLHF